MATAAAWGAADEEARLAKRAEAVYPDEAFSFIAVSNAVRMAAGHLAPGQAADLASLAFLASLASLPSLASLLASLALLA